MTIRRECIRSSDHGCVYLFYMVRTIQMYGTCDAMVFLCSGGGLNSISTGGCSPSWLSCSSFSCCCWSVGGQGITTPLFLHQSACGVLSSTNPFSSSNTPSVTVGVDHSVNSYNWHYAVSYSTSITMSNAIEHLNSFELDSFVVYFDLIPNCPAGSEANDCAVWSQNLGKRMYVCMYVCL